MNVLTIITVTLSAAYGALIVLYWLGWRRQKSLQPVASTHADACFSIIIPARNEAASIRPLLDSIFAQRFPFDAFEVLVVDDHSTDDTADMAESYARSNLTVLRLAHYVSPGEVVNSAKKRALAVGIEHARHPFIVTTDADCIVPPNWLTHLREAFANGATVLTAAPVDFSKSRGILYLFQSLDFMAMQGITAAAHALRLGTMANGANLAFSRAAYQEVGGYGGIDHLASGDDYLLTRKFALRFGQPRLHYILHSGATVRTAPQFTWSGFLQQRIRWASKSGKYNDPRLTAILVLVYAVNSWLLALAIMMFFFAGVWQLLLASLAAKVVLETLFLWPVADFFGKRRELLVFPFLQPLHILYVVLAGFLGMRGGYQWKGRSVR